MGSMSLYPMAGHPTRCCCRAQVSGETGSSAIMLLLAAQKSSLQQWQLHSCPRPPQKMFSSDCDTHSPKQSAEGFAPEVPFPGSLITKLVGIWGHRLSLEQKFQLWWNRGLSYILQILVFTNWHFPANCYFLGFCSAGSPLQHKWCLMCFIW